MEKLRDRLRLSFSIRKKNAFDSINMKPFFKLFDAFLGELSLYAECSDKPKQDISKFSCDLVLDAMDQYKDVVEIFDTKERIKFIIMQEAGGNRSGFSLYMQSDEVKKMDTLGIKSFFTSLVELLPFDYARCHFSSNAKDLHDNEYEKIGDRTFFASGLYWLNFFGPSEEAKQGGKALETNPHATEIKRLENGLFIQVGESPFDCYTEKGRERLINATKAMPPATW